MNCNATVKKFIQITEETQPPVHVPIVFGNECFIVTQQDLRKIEDIRLLSYSKLMPNGMCQFELEIIRLTLLTALGEIIPMEALGHDVSIRDAILNAGKCRMQLDQNAELTSTNMLLEFIRKMLGYPQNMDTSTITPQTQAVATLEQQLQWAKACNAPATTAITQLPQTYTYATPNVDNNTHSIMYHTCNCCSSNNKSINHCCTRGSNTMDLDGLQNDGNEGTLSAREQLKQKKIAQEFS